MELIQLGTTDPTAQKIADKIHQALPSGCKRILLIEPPNVPEEDWDPAVAANNRYPVYDPYGLGVLSACIQLRGYETDIIDLNFMIQDAFKSDPDNFKYQKWQEWLRNKINDFKPDVIGLTCMFTIYHRSMVRIAKFIKEYNPNILVMAGGVHTTMASTKIDETPGQLVLEDCKNIDFVGLYECNDSLPDFIDIANNKIGPEKLTQVATLIDGQYSGIIKRAEPKTETLNIAPAYHDLPIERYSSIGRIGTFYWLRPDMVAATIRFNYGCRAHCRYCSVEKITGKGVVLNRDIDATLDHVEYLMNRGIDHLMFLDDDIFNGEKRAIEFFEKWAKRKLKVTWDASNGVIASALTDEIAHAAYESGCLALSFGIESGNPEVLKNIPKPSGVKHFHRAGEIMKKYPSIFTKGFLMVGFPPEPERNFPGESIRMIWDTINLAKEMDLDWYTIQPLNLIPGVEITNHALAQGIITEQGLTDGSERPVVGSTGKQDRRSKEERTEALPFINHLAGELDRIPQRDELIDIWFMMDFMVNYQKIWRLENPIKINMIHKLFISMCDKTHKENALGNLFFSLLEYTIGNTEQANYRLNLAKEFSKVNDYWRKRFPVLGLDKMIEELEHKINESSSR